MSLKLRSFGRTGLLVSELGFGCSSYWAKSAFPESQACSLVEQAIDGGINLFDTGPSYASGNAEKRLGNVLRTTNIRSNLVICTKVGTHVSRDGRVYRDWSPQSIIRSVKDSLDRLQCDWIDVLHLHAPAITDLTPDLFSALAQLKDELLVRNIGLNSFDNSVVEYAISQLNFDSFMIEYNIIRKSNGALLQRISESGAAALVATPIAQGMFRQSLWPTSPKETWELARAIVKHRSALAVSRQYQFLNEIPSITGGQAALAFVLENRNFSSAVFGTTSSEHLKQNIQAANLTLQTRRSRKFVLCRT